MGKIWGLSTPRENKVKTEKALFYRELSTTGLFDSSGVIAIDIRIFLAVGTRPYMHREVCTYRVDLNQTEFRELVGTLGQQRIFLMLVQRLYQDDWAKGQPASLLDIQQEITENLAIVVREVRLESDAEVPFEQLVSMHVEHPSDVVEFSSGRLPPSWQREIETFKSIEEANRSHG